MKISRDETKNPVYGLDSLTGNRIVWTLAVVGWRINKRHKKGRHKCEFVNKWGHE